MATEYSTDIPSKDKNPSIRLVDENERPNFRGRLINRMTNATQLISETAYFSRGVTASMVGLLPTNWQIEMTRRIGINDKYGLPVINMNRTELLGFLTLGASFVVPVKPGRGIHRKLAAAGLAIWWIGSSIREDNHDGLCDD